MPYRKNLNEDASFSVEQESESSVVGNYNVISFKVNICSLRIEFGSFKWSALRSSKFFTLLQSWASKYQLPSIFYDAFAVKGRY